MASIPSPPIEVAVIGVGRMGRHHARTYKNLTQAHLVAVVDHDMDRAGAVADEYGCDVARNVEELLTRYPGVRAVTVAVPTVHHHAVAAPLLERHVACLVEKPLAPSLDQARELAELAARSGTILQVGHTERFNPAIRAVSQLNLRPQFMEVHRVSPMTFRSLDVGVVMDLMIHDLDIVLSLANSPLVRVDATGVAVVAEREDIANARLLFESGCVANLTASRLALKTERKLRLFSRDTYVSIDYQARSGVLIRKTHNELVLDEVRQQVSQGADLSSLNYTDLVTIEDLTMDLPPDQADPLTAELSSFLGTVRDGGAPVVDGAAGFAAVAAAERVVEAIAAHKWQDLPGARV